MPLSTFHDPFWLWHSRFMAVWTESREQHHFLTRQVYDCLDHLELARSGSGLPQVFCSLFYGFVDGRLVLLGLLNVCFRRILGEF